MISVRLIFDNYQKNRKSGIEQRIRIQYTDGRNKVKRFFVKDDQGKKLDIAPMFFDQDNQRWNEKRLDKDGAPSPSTRKAVNDCKRDFESMVDSLANKSCTSVTNAYEDLRGFIPKTIDGQTILFNDLDRLVNLSERGLKGGKGVGVAGKYKRLKVLLSTWNPELDWEDAQGSIFPEFEEFLSYPFRVENKTVKLSPNTVIAHGKNFRAFAAWHEGKRRVIEKDIVNIIYLDEPEYEQLKGTKLPPYLAKARDTFILQCLIPLRYDDFSGKVNKASVQGTVIKIFQGKNKKVTEIPNVLDPEFIKYYFDEYGDNPRFISNQKQNDYIKEACRIAGIDTLIHRYTNKEKLYPKHELISTHNAIKTFITLSAHRGVSIPAIATATGKSEGTVSKHYKSALSSKQTLREFRAAYKIPIQANLRASEGSSFADWVLVAVDMFKAAGVEFQMSHADGYNKDETPRETLNAIGGRMKLAK